ncbi:MAG: hypothetical protein JXQ73_04640 [Phycisphaerae bacterium]|nr:hypothetical protein [Phycisphaerae bacterium]
MRRFDSLKDAQGSEPAKDWSELGRRVLETSRIATAVHMAKRARRIGQGGAAEDSPRATQGG